MTAQAGSIEASNDKAVASRPNMLNEDLPDHQAWRRQSIAPKDWLVSLPQRCLDELDAAACQVRRDPLPTVLLDPQQFSLAACAQMMDHVRERLRAGIGLAVLDRVPAERYTTEENRALAWLLGSLLGRLVAQKWDGTMVYDVRDTGQALEYGVRRSVTNLDLTFHTDAPWLDLPPELVGLYCINPARQGGVSRFASLCGVHNELRRRHRDLLPRLYRPFPWDRQAEHAPGDDKTARRPIFQYDGRSLMGCFNEKLVATGADLAGESLDREGREALEAMRTIVDSPELWIEFTIERGQVQFINNRQFAHSRTDFTDASEPHLKRHLIRLWTRDEGRRSFHG
jgi:alpha-ketoglutarate-dependent taurine dioxygenase